jgi:hypothetical protein
MKLVGNTTPPAGTFSADELQGLPRRANAATPVLRDGDVFEAATRINPVQTPSGQAQKSDALHAAQMLMDKGDDWNDHEMRALLVRAGWAPRLIKAMELVPPAEQEKARAALAKSAVQYFEENNGFQADIGNDFLRENREMLWTLFAEKGQPLRNSGLLGSLNLPLPKGYEKKIEAALATADCFELFAEMDEALRIFKEEE